jgi:hypothetical protein
MDLPLPRSSPIVRGFPGCIGHIAPLAFCDGCSERRKAHVRTRGVIRGKKARVAIRGNACIRVGLKGLCHRAQLFAPGNHRIRNRSLVGIGSCCNPLRCCPRFCSRSHADSPAISRNIWSERAIASVALGRRGSWLASSLPKAQQTRAHEWWELRRTRLAKSSCILACTSRRSTRSNG